MRSYIDLLKYIMSHGTEKKNRTGINTISTFAYQFRHDMIGGFPLLTTKKIKWENILFENLWFLGGDSKWDFLHKHGITFWDAWDEGDGQLPEAYGEYWRAYPAGSSPIITDTCSGPMPDIRPKYFDQFKAIIDGLKKDRNNRRLVLTNWYPPSAYEAKLPPCHLLSIFNVQYDDCGMPRLCLHMTQRSCDVPVGVPFNIAGYALILSLISHLANIPPGELVITLVDAHIYENQMAGVEEQIIRTPGILPSLLISDDIRSLEDVDALIKDGTTQEIMSKFKLVGYSPQSFIKYPVAV